MTPLDTLAPDQRAVLELVLRQGRSYGELSELLAIPEREVRARADAGLRALAGEPAAGVDSGRIADWLLGQQPDADAERTRAAVARSEDARAWAATAADRLGELGGAVPSVPAADAADRAARPRPLRDESSGDRAARPRPVRDRSQADGADRAARPRPRRDESSGDGADRAALPRSSRLGGAILIGVVALLVGATLLWIFVLRDDEEDPASAPPAATATPTAAANANDIVLQGTGESQAQGLMRLIPREGGSVQFAIAAQDVPPNEGREVYAVWFTREGGQPRRLGFAQTPVGEDGILTTGGPQEADMDKFPNWFATYEKVLITRETSATAKRPGPAVLEGTLPAGEG
jgi:Sigma-70, region 4